MLLRKSVQSATRIDIAVLVSALFLQRFSLPFRDTLLQLSLVAIGFILAYQFISGKLVIDYDRLFWFLGLALAVTCSFLLNFQDSKWTAYAQTIILFSLFTLRKPSNPDQRKETLQVFQFIIMLLSCIALVQFAAQFVVDGTRLMNFYGVIPNFVELYNSSRTLGTSLIKSNGLFLAEPSALSEMTALAILIEILNFRRPRYLVLFVLGFLLAYSGTGVMLLLVFLPLACLRHDKALPYTLLVVIFAAGAFVTGIIDLSGYASRVGEVETQGSSGYARFVSPFVLAAEEFHSQDLRVMVFGSGPGTVKSFAATGENTRYTGDFAATWIKILHEFGIIGCVIHACFVAGCLRRSRCPSLVAVAIIFSWLFLQGIITIAIPMCTLNRLEPRRSRVDNASRYRSFAVGEGKPT